jgi:hypothetical protein
MPRLNAFDHDKNGVEWDIRQGGRAECTVWILERLQNARCWICLQRAKIIIVTIFVPSDTACSNTNIRYRSEHFWLARQRPRQPSALEKAVANLNRQASGFRSARDGSYSSKRG